MNKIKIAFIISNLGQGGAEKQFVRLITNLEKSKYDVSLLLYAVQTKPFFEAELMRHKIRIKKVKLFYRFVPIKIAEALYRINLFLKDEKYDLVVTSLFMNNLFVRLAAPRRYKNRIVTNMRTSVKNYSGLYKLIEKKLIPTSYVVFNSKNALKNFKSLIREKHHPRLNVIYNGYEKIDLSYANISPKVVFGSLGRLSIEKNILQAVRVFQEFEKNNLEARYIVQGHFGDQYKSINEILTSVNIEILKKDPNIDKFYSSINILILPSLFEGCPNVLFEALLRKKLVIISMGANSDQFIVDGKNGFVYDGTDNDLLKKMKIAANLRKEEYYHIVEAGYQYAYENFRIETMARKYEELFLQIYEKNKSSR